MSEEAKINCQTFHKQDNAIKAVTDRINAAEGVQKKAPHAKDLKKELDVLVSCPDYNDKSLDCGNCRFVTNLRMRTANLIIKAERLA